jgi:release factor glutamine methyltransferase
MAETWTVLRLLTWTTDYLKSHGSESPRLDAEVLLAHARGCERIMLYAAFDEVVPDDVRALFRDLVKRRAEGTPVAYLVGKREFYSLALRVTPDVLIPRPETEFVVVAALDVLGGGSSPKSGHPRSGSFQSPKSEPEGSGFGVQGSDGAEAEIPNPPPPSPQPLAPSPLVCDVGTGSGAIAVAIARHAPDCRVTAIDISPAALEVAKENAAMHHVAERIEFLQGDLLTPVPAEPRFSVIASNPPYVSESEYSALAPQVKDHEPRQALLAGPTGAETIERLIPQAAERLFPGGWLILEISPMIASRVVELIAADGRYEPATTVKDLAGLARVIKARRMASLG